MENETDIETQIGRPEDITFLEKNPRAKPDTYDWEDDWELAKKIRRLASRGLSNKQIAQALGISYGQFMCRRERFPHIQRALLDGKSEADKAILAKTFQTAMGGQEVVTIKETSYGGKKKVEVTRTELPPDAAQQRFWLTNRDKKNWTVAEESNVNVNFGIINTQIAEADLDRIRRSLGSFISGTKQIESAVIDTQRNGDGTVRTDSDAASG